MPTYQTRNPLARTNPLRSISFMRPASEVFGSAWKDGAFVAPAIFAPAPAAVVAPLDPVRELADAEAVLRDVVRVYDVARAGIGEANRHTLPDPFPAFIRRQAGPFVPVRLSAERIRQRKSAAFSLFNKRRGELSRARRRVDAARAAFGQTSLAVVEERAAVAVVVRASKQALVVHHAIASGMAAAG